MAITREIAAEQWKAFCPAFTERNAGRPTRLETTVEPGEGVPVLAEHQPLLSVDFDPKGSAAPAVILTLGGVDTKTPEIRHVVNDPIHLWVEEEIDGSGVALAVESRKAPRTTLIFEPEPALPP